LEPALMRKTFVALLTLMLATLAAPDRTCCKDLKMLWTNRAVTPYNASKSQAPVVPV